MNQNYNDDFSAISLNKFQSNDLKKTNLLFRFLVFNTFVALLLLITILYPFKKYKELLVKFFSIQLSINNMKLKIYHILLIIIGLYITLYYYLKVIARTFIPNKNETYIQRMIRLDQKWVVESEIWMTFLIIISLISIYRNAHLFNRELQNEERIKKIDEKIKEMDKDKDKRN